MGSKCYDFLCNNFGAIGNTGIVHKFIIENTMFFLLYKDNERYYLVLAEGHSTFIFKNKAGDSLINYNPGYAVKIAD
jgi:hypothetical protein